MANIPIDLDLLAKHLQTKIDAERISIRTAASQIGCSPQTLMRLLQGTASATVPDSKNLFRAASWLRKSISDFERGHRPARSTLADVEVHLRALPGLTEADKDALMAMVKAAHDAARELRKKNS